MPLCRFSNTYGMYDVTPVENLFIDEFMLRAPGDYVKVYLYGLKLCYQPGGETSAAALGRALGMEESAVAKAFAYWERQGVLRAVAPEGYEYLNLKDVLFNQGLHADPALTKYASLNRALEQLFGDRMLLPQDYQKIYDWVEVFGLREEVVLELVRHGIARHGRGRRVPITYLDRIAQTWAADGVNTLEEAQARAQEEEARQLGVSKVLASLGQRRAATVYEQEFFLKWTRQWGFDLPAILAACRETTKASKPSFAYVDRILDTYRERGLLRAEQIEADRQGRAADDEPVRQWMAAMGQRSAPTDALRQIYAAFREQGMEHEVLLAAARYNQKHGRTAPADQEKLLTYWLKLGIHTKQDWDAHMARITRLNALCAEVLERAEDRRAAQGADQAMYQRWEALGFPHETILLAASYARGSQNPMAFCNRILENWHREGIHGPEEARRAHEARGGRGDKARGAREAFDQRTYSDEDFKHLYADLDQY